MKIAFICSCLEPGKDGVGDHMRLMGSECASQSGGESMLFAINDTLAPNEKERREVQAGLQTFRLNSILSWKEKAELLGPELEKFAPDAISFHYVPFAYHPRGFAVGWPSAIGKLIRGRPLHWMFHEIWVGAYLGAPFKLRLMGAIQREGLRRVIKKWKPKVLHTSNPFYSTLLEDAGISSKRLKLYGTIPAMEPGIDLEKWFCGTMAEAGLEFEAEQRDSYWVGIFFGTLHTNWPHEPFFSLLSEAARKHDKKVIILSLGYLRTGEELWSRIQEDYAKEFRFIRLGERSVEDIARFFAAVDFGITTSPTNILGKSSVAAAMMEHGLPIVSNWEGSVLRTKSGGEIPKIDEPLVWKADETLPEKLAGMSRKGRHFDSELPRVARTILEDLKLP